MLRTIDFLDALRTAYNLTSDYQVAKKLGVTPQTISNWRKGRDFMGETTAFAVAAMLELPAAYVYASAQLERVKSPEAKSVWEEIFNKLKPSPTEAERLNARWPGHVLCSMPRAYNARRIHQKTHNLSPSVNWISAALAPNSAAVAP